MKAELNEVREQIMQPYPGKAFEENTASEVALKQKSVLDKFKETQGDQVAKAESVSVSGES